MAISANWLLLKIYYIFGFIAAEKSRMYTITGNLSDSAKVDDREPAENCTGHDRPK